MPHSRDEERKQEESMLESKVRFATHGQRFGHRRRRRRRRSGACRRQSPHRHGRQSARQRLLRRLSRRRVEAAKELGNVDLIYTGPTKATAEEQIAVIELAHRAESRRHRDFGQRPQRAGAGLQEGDGPRHQGDFVQLRRRSRRSDHAPQPLQQRAHRRQVRADDG